MLARFRSSRQFGFALELVMLVVGINIALWAEGAFEDYKDQQTEIDYLQGLRRDLSKDIERLESVVEVNVAKVERRCLADDPCTWLPQPAGWIPTLSLIWRNNAGH